MVINVIFTRHSIYLFRALWERPGYYNIRQGMIKARSAIENTLCHENMNFLDLKDIIVAIIGKSNF